MIDLVMPYVNNKEKVWITSFKIFCKTHKEYAYKLQEINGERYRDDYNLFELNLKLIRACLPFIRTIHLIVSNPEQVKGLDLTGVHLVLHKDIMPESILPTFNSSTIEMFIHKIEGLSERFIYQNDDMIPLRVMSESDFFDGDKAKITIFTQHETTNNSLFRQMVLNQYREVFKGTDDYLGDDFYLRPEHSATPMFLSVVKYTREKYKDIIDAHLEAFRNEYQHTQYLYVYEMIKQGRVCESDQKFIYLKLRDTKYLENCYKICDTKGAWFNYMCVNDDIEDSHLQDKDLRYKVLRRALELCLQYITEKNKK